MNIVQLSSESIRELRQQRKAIVQSMIEKQQGSLLVLRGAFVGDNRGRNSVSYAVFMMFFELWERFNFESWSYTFDDEGLIFYVELDEDAKSLKEIMVRYEDNHPLGFAIDTEVYGGDQKWRREDLGLEPRLDVYYEKPLLELLDEVQDDPKYTDFFTKRVEGIMVKGDKATIISNILVYSYVSAFTKYLGFGMYAPNYKGSNEHMNFEKFVHLVRTYKEEVKRVFSINNHSVVDIERYLNDVERKIQGAMLNQQSYRYSIFTSSIVIIAFIHSRGYADITKNIKVLGEHFMAHGYFDDEPKRYQPFTNGMREVFTHYVPFLQKNKSTTATLLHIMSRHDDASVILHNGEQSLLKLQFLAKNLVNKPEKWVELDKFCTSSYIYPHDDTVLLAVTCMLDVMQRNYLKIKMLFDTNEK